MSNNLAFLIGIGIFVVFMFFVRHLSKTEVLLFAKEGLSLDETKISILMISFIIFIGISIWSVFALGDIPDNVLYLTLGLGGGIAGMNISNSSISRTQLYNQAISSFDNNNDDEKIYENDGGK